MTSIMQLVGLATGEPSPVDGQYLVEYDPTRPGRLPDGTELTAHLVTTPDPDKARRFADAREVHAVWTAESGQPYPRNRPLTAYTIALVRVGEGTPEHAPSGLCQPVEIVDHGPVKPPYGTPEREAYDREHGGGETS